MIHALFLAFALLAQTPATLHDEPLTLPAIVYPAAARIGHVQGVVHLEVAVDPSGHVFGVKALDGPEPLRQAAVDAYTKATYKPLLVNGKPGPAIVTTQVNFTLNEAPPDTDQLVDKQFQNEQALCQQLSNGLTPKSPAAGKSEALEACRHTVEASRRFPAGVELEQRATALNDLVLLLIAPGKRSTEFPAAGSLAEEAIDLVAGSTPHTPAIATAYITRAEVRSLAGDLPGAIEDCAVAEEALTTTLHDNPESERAGRYRVQLRETLQLHAVVLDRQPSKANKAEAKLLRARSEQY